MTLQIPESSFCIATPFAPSRDSITAFALGARNRKVTELSGCTSGEMTGERGAERGGAAAGDVDCAQDNVARDSHPTKTSLPFWRAVGFDAARLREKWLLAVLILKFIL